jgi:hypothetical protein
MWIEFFSSSLPSNHTRCVCELSRLFVHLSCELGVVLLEAVADALLRSHPLLDAAVDATAFPG